MAHTYHQHLYHLVWSTKDRKTLIPNEIKLRLFEYLAGALKTTGCTPIQVGGMSDHVHILASIPPKFALSDIVRDIKICSTKWYTTLYPNKTFSWQEGYGSFTVSFSQMDSVLHYILNQDEHHRKLSFRDEFIMMLKKSGVQFDESYLWC